MANLYVRAMGQFMPDFSDPESTDLYFLRLAELQLGAQKAVRHALGRVLLLFEDIPKEENTSAFSISERFVELIGLTVPDFVRTALWVTHKVTQEDKFKFSASTLVEAGGPISVMAADHFLTATSVDVDAYRAQSEKLGPTDEELELFGFNPIALRPIVKTGSDEYILPLPPLLLENATIGVYHHLLTAYKKPFLDALGPVFEKYVGALLAEFYGPQSLVGELSYRKGQCRSSDWAIIEGRNAVLLECKTARLTLQTKTEMTSEKLTADLRKGIVQALIEMNRVMEDVRNRLPGLEPLYDKEFFPVVLLLDDFELGNIPTIRSLVQEELRAKYVTPFDYQVLSVAEIEWGLPFIKKRGMFSLLKQKANDASDLMNSPAFWSFARFIAEVGARDPDAEALHPLLAARIDELIRT